jgi:integrase
VADLQWEPDGVRITVRQSKTDQEGTGMTKGLPYAERPEYCPVRALRAWLDAADLEAGPVFRPVSKTGTVLPRRLTSQWVALVVKHALGPVARAQAERAWAKRSPTQQGRDDRAVWIAAYVARLTRRYAGHSLRAGFVTSAAAAGARLDEIMDQTGQKDVATVMRYVRNARAVRTSAAAKLGL